MYWGKSWETNIITGTHYGKILCFGAKWLGEKVKTRGWVHFKRNKELATLKELWKLLDEADLVVGQNIKSFDLKWVNTRFAFFNLPPPSPFRVIDTRNEARKYLYLPSYRLDDMARYFHIGQKTEHEGFGLWEKCLSGNKSAWKKMLKYCGNDVVLTEKVYLKLRQFIEARQVYFNGVCTHCGSRSVQRRGLTLNKKHYRIQCRACGGWGQNPAK